MKEKSSDQLAREQATKSIVANIRLANYINKHTIELSHENLLYKIDNIWFIFKQFIKIGFSEEQSFELIKNMITPLMLGTPVVAPTQQERRDGGMYH